MDLSTGGAKPGRSAAMKSPSRPSDVILGSAQHCCCFSRRSRSSRRASANLLAMPKVQLPSVWFMWDNLKILIFSHFEHADK